jgi:serine/threonine protein phosphatase PrpC
MTPEADYELVLGGATVRLRVSSASDVGRVRKLNEDSFLAALPVALVADGMGGHALGDKASQAVVATFETIFRAAAPTAPATVISAISRANNAVRALTAEGERARSVAGTTLAGVALVDLGLSTDGGSGFYWMAFNVGDSRLYSWNGSALSQVSVDHSAVQELVDQGLITHEQAATHPERNVITRAVGVDSEVDADVWFTAVGGRQLYLMCSDGLTKEVDDEAIATLLREFDADRAVNPAERLVSMALEAGGTDNVTAVVVESEVLGGMLPHAEVPVATLANSLGPDSLEPDSLEDTLPMRKRNT